MEIFYTPVLLNLVKVIVAMLCGGLLGLERLRNREAGGILVQVLVAMGAALFMIVSQSVSPLFISGPADMAAKVVIGAGLLGAGIIIREKGLIKGLGTAASIWISAAIGLAIGAGLFFEGIFIAIIAYLTIGWLQRYLNV